MSIKVSDIMLDLETGDASPRDAYIQEAMGQVKVSAAYYDAAKKIACLEPSEMTEVIQEAATNNGLPTDRENAINFMYEAAEHELIGTLRHFYQEAAKIDEVGSKPTTPLAGLNQLGKVCGVKKTLDGTKEYAAEFAQAVMKNKDLNLKGGAKFLKAGAAKKATKNLIDGFEYLAKAFGIDISALANDSSVKALCPTFDGKASSDDCSLSQMVAYVKKAGKAVKGTSISDGDYTTSVSKTDVATVVLCNFAVTKVAGRIKAAFGSNGAKLESKINACMKKCNKKNISGDTEDLNSADGSAAKDINADINKLVDELITGFNNSFYSLLQAKGEEN